MTPDSPGSAVPTDGRMPATAGGARQPGESSGSAGLGPSTPATKTDRHFRSMVIAALILSAGSTIFAALALLVVTGVIPGARQLAFERQVQSYILANPETIIDSLKGLDARQKAAEQNELTKVVDQRREEIFNDPAAPVGANPNGDVTLVEFFDYNCPYCRQAAPMLMELEQKDPGLRLVFKEFPILGPGSTFAARAALASRKQGKYLAFHKAMMAYNGAIGESSTLEVAAAVGLDVEQLKKDMEDPAIDQAITRNLALAEALRISGTPSFVVGKEILRGLADADTMKRLIATARQK